MSHTDAGWRWSGRMVRPAFGSATPATAQVPLPGPVRVTRSGSLGGRVQFGLVATANLVQARVIPGRRLDGRRLVTCAVACPVGAVQTFARPDTATPAGARRVRKRFIRAALSFHAIGLALCLASGAAHAACDPAVADVRGDFGQARFSVEIADSVPERSKGLMFRDSMPMSSGMLFIYPRPQRASFWMRNTLIPLDMLFLDASGRVTRVHARAMPGDETPIDGGRAVSAVLEINGGLAARLGIAEGAQIRHPAFDPQSAAWPCEPAPAQP